MPDNEYDPPPLTPEIAAVFPGCSPWFSGSDGLRERIFKALRPFALMDRSDSDPTELACVRGTASDMTVLTSGDFSEAFSLLCDLGDSEFAEQVSGDSRYDPEA